MHDKLNKTEARAIIRKWANERGLRYRVTASDGVDFYGDFYGDFPNAAAAGRGWWHGGWHWEDVAEDIQEGRR